MPPRTDYTKSESVMWLLEQVQESSTNILLYTNSVPSLEYFFFFAMECYKPLHLSE